MASPPHDAKLFFFLPFSLIHGEDRWSVFVFCVIQVVRYLYECKIMWFEYNFDDDGAGGPAGFIWTMIYVPYP